MKVVILDIGNVLVDYNHQKTMDAVAQGAGCSTEELYRFFDTFGPGLTVGEYDVRQLYEAIVDDTGALFDYNDFLTCFSAGITRDDEALAYAVNLQNRSETTVAVISNTNDGHVSWLDKHLPELRELDLVIMSNEVYLAKPDAAIYKLALEQLNLLPQQAFFVDDLEVNVRAANTLDMAGIVHEDWAITQPKLEEWLVSSSTG